MSFFHKTWKEKTCIQIIANNQFSRYVHLCRHLYPYIYLHLVSLYLTLYLCRYFCLHPDLYHYLC